MFLCDDCHDSTCPGEWIEDFARSYGRCEDCKKSASCVDCQGYKRKSPPQIIKPAPPPQPTLCGRCMNPQPCGCYSHEARLGIPYPSSTDKVLEAYAEQYGQQMAKLIALRQLVFEDDSELARKVKEVLDGA